MFSSPPTELDVTIFSFKDEELEQLNNLIANLVPFEVSTVMPVINKADPTKNDRLYVIGHPKGGALQFSMQDNLLLDCGNPKIHYRTPTEGGNSGSPVFNEQWQLVAVHHAGRKDLPKLNGEEGFYEANEGIWFQSVKEAFSKMLLKTEVIPSLN